MSKLEHVVLLISIVSASISGLSALLSLRTYRRAIPRVILTITREEYSKPKPPIGYPESVNLGIKIRNEGMTRALVERIRVIWVIDRRWPLNRVTWKKVPRPTSWRVFRSELLADLSDEPLKIDSWDAVDRIFKLTIPDLDSIPRVTILGVNDLLYARAYLCIDLKAGPSAFMEFKVPLNALGGVVFTI